MTSAVKRAMVNKQRREGKYTPRTDAVTEEATR